MGGEVKIPGFYTLSGESGINKLSKAAETNQFESGGFNFSSKRGIGELPEEQHQTVVELY